jgi:hypothetical protein
VGAYLGGAAALTGFAFTGRGLGGLLLAGVAVGVLAYAESPPLQAVFADAVGQREGRATLRAFFAIACGAGALWLAVVGWVIDAFGFTTAFVVMAASFVAAAGLVAFSSRPHKSAAAVPATGG